MIKTTGKCKIKHEMIEKLDGQGHSFITCLVCGITPVKIKHNKNGNKRPAGEVQDE